MVPPKKPPPVVPKKSVSLPVTAETSTRNSVVIPESIPSPRNSTEPNDQSPQKFASTSELAAVNSRCDKMEKTIQELRRDLASALGEVRRLTVELDEEKKLRLSSQVDLDRLRITVMNGQNNNLTHSNGNTTSTNHQRVSDTLPTTML